MITVPAEATRKGTECSGGPGRLAWTTRCHRVTVDPPTGGPAPSGSGGSGVPGGRARARRRPRSIRSRTRRRHRALRLEGSEHHRLAPEQAAGHHGHDPLRLRLGRGRVLRQHDLDDHRLLGLALPLPDHEHTRRGRWPASGPTGGSRPAWNGRTPRGSPAPEGTRQGDSPAGVGHALHPWGPECRGAAPRGGDGSVGPRPPGPTTAGRTGRRRPARPRSTPARRGVRGSGSPPPDGNPATDPRPGPPVPSATGAGCGWARWPPGSAPPVGPPRSPRGTPCRPPLARGPGTAGPPAR